MSGKMEDEVIALFTTKSALAWLELSGTESWVLDPKRANRCRYAVLCRDPEADLDGKEFDDKAFMIGRIASVVPSPETRGRWMPTFDAYAAIAKPKAWKNWRNPVRYTTLAKLGINLKAIKFRPMPNKAGESEATLFSEIETPIDIETAKRGVAAYYGVRPEAVEIKIRR